MEKPCGSPLVCVVMPAYNAGAYIDESIASVQAQTYQNWKLYVVDDGSRDDTPGRLRQLADCDSRIIPVLLPENRGVAHARNTGMDRCDGEYIAFLDSDDIWYPTKLETQVALAEKTGADVLYCSYDMQDVRGIKTYQPFIVPERTDFDSMLTRSVMSCSTVMLRQKTAGKKRFETRYYHEDYVFWLRLLQDGMEAIGTTEPLAQYRIVSGSRSANKFRAAAKRWRIYRSYLELPFFRAVSCFFRYAAYGIRKYY